MKDKEIKEIVDTLKGGIEAQFVAEYMEDGYSNIESITEYAAQEYEEEHEVEFSDEDYEKFLLYMKEEIDTRDLIETIQDSEYVRKFGMLAYVGMSEKDFL